MSDIIAATGTQSVSSAVRVLMYVQIAFIAAAVAALLFLIFRKYVLDNKSQEITVAQAVKPEGTLRGISVDPSSAKRDFVEGEAFNYDGLTVNADYGSKSERVTDFTVDAPDMSTVGSATVTVRYGGFSADYDIRIGADREPRFPIGMTLDTTNARTQFVVGEAFDSSGLKVSMEYNLEPFTAPATDYMVDAPDTFVPGERTVYVRSEGFVETYTVTVIGDASDYGDTSDYGNDDETAGEFAYGDYYDLSAADSNDAYKAHDDYADYDDSAGDYAEIYDDTYYSSVNDSTVETAHLPQKSEQTDATAYAEHADAATDVGTSDDTVLRYDRSFIARLAQASDATKAYYSAIKNEVLAYDGVKARMSWKRETFKAEGQHVAKLGFRGNTLCLLLPLDPAPYVGTRYKVEDVSSDKSGEDTPCLFRIKNDKRLRLSYDLIARVMQERGLIRSEHEDIDYTEPYRDDAQLLKAGLVRRELKTREEEDSVFMRGKNAGGEE